jgi:diguanylate cyclase (GGDEF)-like protein
MQKLIDRGDGSSMLAVIIADLDGLKPINDGYGHPMGDAALVAVAEALHRDRAIVGRYGGDEFVALLPGANRERAERYKQEVVKALQACEVIDEASGTIIPVGASIGIAIYPEDAASVTPLIELADSGMYAEKRSRPVVRPRLAA